MFYHILNLVSFCTWYVKILGNSSSQTWNENDWTSHFFLNQFETFADMYMFHSPEVDFFWNVWMWQVFTTSLTFFPFHWMNKMQNANWFCIYHLKFDLKVSIQFSNGISSLVYIRKLSVTHSRRVECVTDKVITYRLGW